MQYFQFLTPQLGFSIPRAFMKGFVLIIAGRLVFDNVTLLVKMETPKYLQRYTQDHPINPPIYEPHRMEEPEEYEQFQELWRKLESITMDNRINYMYKKTQHPSLEDNFIIREALFESESERVFDEIKSEIRRINRESSKSEFEGLLHQIEKRVLFQSLDCKIKPIS